MSRMHLEFSHGRQFFALFDRVHDPGDRPLPRRALEGVADLNDYREHGAFRIREMWRRLLRDEQAEAVLLGTFELRIIGPQALPVAINECRKPTVVEFASSFQAWRLAIGIGRWLPSFSNGASNADMRGVIPASL
jgi:hypothetical protein